MPPTGLSPEGKRGSYVPSLALRPGVSMKNLCGRLFEKSGPVEVAKRQLGLSDSFDYKRFIINEWAWFMKAGGRL